MRIEFPCKLRRRLCRAVQRAGSKEIGGILMAEQVHPGEFRLVDYTVDSHVGGESHFLRSVVEHQKALAEFFSRTNFDFARFNYLGEWHSHPNHAPVPSFEDVSSMHSLVNGENDIPFAVLIIVRVRWLRLMLSATVFERGATPRGVVVLCS